MKQDYIEGKTYQSTTHGLVTYRGLDSYFGQVSMMFESPKYGMKYWLPTALRHHFEAER